MKVKKIIALVVAVLCLSACIISASAATVTVSKVTTSFGTITGTLYKSTATLYETGFLKYEFLYGTQITRLPSDTTQVFAYVDIVNSATGGLLYQETADNTYATDKTSAGYYIQLDHFDNIRGENAITVTVFGAHEARANDAVVIYSSNTYNLERDHGIV